MCKFRLLPYLLLFCSAALVAAKRSRNRTSLWQTLNGNAPLVIARGGFSGLFPDSSSAAYSLAIMTSLPSVILWCDVQLTKDGVGICFPDIRLENASAIRDVFKNKENTYSVNGQPVQGYFSLDFTINELGNVFLTQGIYYRSNSFDANLFPILTVQDVVKQMRPPGLWLNIQHDEFFIQHNLSMRKFVLSAFRSIIINYISSPEVNFLRNILARTPKTTKLIFRFLEKNEIEPSTNQTYGYLLNNLTFVKMFASGILVPKSYIWPVVNLYLQPHTPLVLDAHKEGLEVFASDFSNDFPFAYNHSYNPVTEFLSFIDNGNFSVDGFLSDFPITASEAIDCFSHISKNGSGQATPLVISYRGASGDYPGCTDMAYKQAISDGVDVLDCPVQMTKDGIPVCLGSINLIDSTTVGSGSSNFSMTTIPELFPNGGIFTFSFPWSQIQNLTPAISNPYTAYRLYRNPKYGQSGKLMTLSVFLAFAKNSSSVSGVLISIENAAYLAEKQNLSVIDAVSDALSEAGYNNQTVKKVMIQSTNSSVLKKFKEKSNYELVYDVDEKIRDVLNTTILDIKKFANFVVIKKSSVFPEQNAFLTGVTDVVSKLKASGLPVFVQLFSNEFISQAWDFFSDANIEINTYVTTAGIAGIITDFPATAVKYRNNRCLNLGSKTPPYMSPVEPGSLFQLVPPYFFPPAEAPNPVLTDADVVEPPLALNNNTAVVPTSDTNNGSTPTAPTSPNGKHKAVACIFLSNLAIILITLMLF